MRNYAFPDSNNKHFEKKIEYIFVLFYTFFLGVDILRFMCQLTRLLAV